MRNVTRTGELLRDRLQAALASMGAAPDYQRLASDVLGISNAPPALARRLVSVALVVEDRRAQWTRVGERICAAAPTTPGVYILRGSGGEALYVGKAINVRRRLRSHFAGRRWRALRPELARIADAEWISVGSDLEAELREAELIARLKPTVNVQTGEPNLATRAVRQALVRDVVVVTPSVEADSVELVAARVDGSFTIQRTRRNGADLAVHAARLRRFFSGPSLERRQGSIASPRLAPIVFSWLARRGAGASRLDPHDAPSANALARRLRTLLADASLFEERLVIW
jgi:hypothetical protein